MSERVKKTLIFKALLLNFILFLSGSKSVFKFVLQVMSSMQQVMAILGQDEEGRPVRVEVLDEALLDENYQVCRFLFFYYVSFSNFLDFYFFSVLNLSFLDSILYFFLMFHSTIFKILSFNVSVLLSIHNFLIFKNLSKYVKCQ